MQPVPWSLRRAARLIQRAAEASAYAHGLGIIHRDLKPANLLLDSGDQLRVTDFGLAKCMEGEGDLTQTGQVMGTPSFMPPEQAQGKLDRIGPWSDVYSLGASLYCLLTGRPPFQAANVLDTLKQVVDIEPIPPRGINPAVDGDLNTICLKCLDKVPERRYATAQALADDLQAFLDGRPIQARPVGQVGKLVRWCRRNPLVAASLTLLATVLVAGAVGSVLAAVAFRAARDVADGARSEAVSAAEGERWERYRANVASTAIALQLHNGDTARRLLDEAPPEHRNWEWAHFNARLDGNSTLLPYPNTGIKLHALSENQSVLAVAAPNENEAHTYATSTGLHLAVLRGHTAAVTLLTISADGAEVSTGSEDGTIRIWNSTTGACKATLPAEPTSYNAKLQLANCFVRSADGERLLICDFNSRRLRDAKTGKLIANLSRPSKWARAALFSKDGRRVFFGSEQGVQQYDANSGTLLGSISPKDEGRDTRPRIHQSICRRCPDSKPRRDRLVLDHRKIKPIFTTQLRLDERLFLVVPGRPRAPG